MRELLIARSFATSEANKTGSWRYLMPRYQEKTAPCSTACPAGEDIGRVEMLIAQGFFKEAWETILLENPFPGVCGRVCHHPCERICNRGPFDEAVSIRTLERFVADTAHRYEFTPQLDVAPSRPEKIAIVGAGPAGLSAAYFLSLLGYSCDVFDAAPEPGGVLRWGLPAYRLPREVLQKEIERVRQIGFRLHGNTALGPDFLETAADAYQAVFLGCGLSAAPQMGIPGETLPQVVDGLTFLQTVARGAPQKIAGNIVVIGGGNTAVDAARTALRLGGEVSIVYRRRREDMPAFEEEITAALDEGIELRELLIPTAIEPDGGRCRLMVQPMRIDGAGKNGRARVLPSDDPVETLTADLVLAAIGFEPAASWTTPANAPAGIMELRHSCLTETAAGLPLIYGGDLTTEVKSVVHAVASGKEASLALDLMFRQGKTAILPGLAAASAGAQASASMEIYRQQPRARRSTHVVAAEEINVDYFEYAPRLKPPRLLTSERRSSFDEIDLKISAGIAIKEAERCFNCGLCNQCDNCRLYCPDLAVGLDPSPAGRKINYDYCKGCGICVVECPRNAMVLEEEKQS